MIFHNKDAKSHFYYFPQMQAGLSGMVKVGGCVYQKVSTKQLLIIIIKVIIRSDYFSSMGLRNTQQKAVRLYFVFA